MTEQVPWGSTGEIGTRVPKMYPEELTHGFERNTMRSDFMCDILNYSRSQTFLL